jgi:hypothetical protein
LEKAKLESEAGTTLSLKQTKDKHANWNGCLTSTPYEDDKLGFILLG